MNFQNNFNKKATIVPKNTTFQYSKKTPKQIIEEREMRRTLEKFNNLNKDKININNKLNQISFKNKFNQKI